jgi:hypothetical protein
MTSTRLLQCCRTVFQTKRTSYSQSFSR